MASFLFFLRSPVNAQSLQSFYIYDSIHVTIDRPARSSATQTGIVAFFALPNGNTTAQTIGKKMEAGDDWHFDIQHIGAQTKFIREQLKKTNFTVIYLESKYRSWPAWKQKHDNFKELLPHLVDSLRRVAIGTDAAVYLNGHSGGGSFIFGFLAGSKTIPSYVERISFLDSDYGYDSTYYPMLREWLQKNKKAALNVFAYNDSVVIYNGKPIVSPTGGTWYRSWLLLKQLQNDFTIKKLREDSLIVFKSDDQRVQFFFRTNPQGLIFHTVQVERNGFIHSILCGTRVDSRRYRYYGDRAYKIE